jgi:AsmA protein
MIGTREGGPPSEAKPKNDTGRVLPNIPFRTERWNTIDADLRISAKEIRRIKDLPITNLSTHLVMKDAALKLDPLKFDMAGGSLSGSLTLDGSKQPMRTAAKLNVRKLTLARLLPATDVPQANLGRVDGLVDLSGSGDSIAHMLGSADGRLGLVINGGQVSRLTMETVGLHLLEILALRIGGDEPINIRCGIGDFGIKRGVMKSQVLVFDTEVNNVQGAGSVDFAQERLNLTLLPHTKETRLTSLRSPIYLRGTFAHPQIQLDTGTLTAKGLAALGLGAVNPLLALVPLLEQGPGKDSNCGKLIEETLKGGQKGEG